MLQNPLRTTIVYEGGTFCSEKTSGSFNDISFSWEKGSLSVSAETTPLYRVKTEWEIQFSEYALFLGDTLERSYGDLGWKKSIHRPAWYVMVQDKETVYGFGVKTSPNALCFWSYQDGILTLDTDIRSGTYPVHLNGRMLQACTLVSEKYKGNAFEATKQFCRKMCDRPRLPNHRIYGGNDWYCCYGKNSHDIILEHAKRIASCAPKNAHKPYMVIDDGWEFCAQTCPGGPWDRGNRMFTDMEEMAKELEAAGVIPGIWFRPLYTYERMPDSFYLESDSRKNFLDPSVPEVLEQVKQDVLRFKKWGYKLIKHDYSTYDIFNRFMLEEREEVVEGTLRFSTNQKTTAEIVKALYQALRDAAGDDVLLLGCNTIGHLGAGIFELQRIGDDTSGVEWERTVKMGVNTLAFRLPQENAFFAIDADCVGITNEVPFSKNQLWLDALTESGTALFVSIAQDAFSPEVEMALKHAFEKSVAVEKGLEPLDWMENNCPVHWKNAEGTEFEYKWEV